MKARTDQPLVNVPNDEIYLNGISITGSSSALVAG